MKYYWKKLKKMFVNIVIILIVKKKIFHCDFEKCISNAAEKIFHK